MFLSVFRRLPQNIGDNRIVIDGVARITNEDAERLNRYLLRAGDIVCSRRGDVTRRAIIRAEQDGWLCGTGCLRVRFGQGPVDPVFASHYLAHPSVRGWIERHAIGATLSNLNTAILSALPFVIPPRADQQRIAHILGTLDDKIELNRRMNETLEAMARAIFKSWFVDFDPVRAKAEGRQPAGMDAETAALFPDSFQDSPLGKIPSGWKIQKIGDICEFAYGKALKEESRWPGSVPVYGSNGRIGWHDEALVRGPGVVVGRKGNPGTVTWVPSDFFPIDTTFYVISAGSVKSVYYLFYALSTLDLASLGADSAVPGLNRNMAYMTATVTPPGNIASVFERLVEPFARSIAANDHQSRILAAVRDGLLPKWISGEIRVRDSAIGLRG